MWLFEQRWNVRVLSELHRLGGSRFVVLKSNLGVSAESLARCLEGLAARGLIMRNPGYGHPLRPEYILTEVGRAIGADCYRFAGICESLDVVEVAYRKWSVPLLLAVESGCNRFNDLKQELGVTPRALSGGLSRLCGAHLLARDELYRATPPGLRVVGAAEALRFPG